MSQKSRWFTVQSTRTSRRREGRSGLSNKWSSRKRIEGFRQPTGLLTGPPQEFLLPSQSGLGGTGVRPGVASIWMVEG